MGIFDTFWLFYDARSQNMVSHMTQDADFENFLFCPDSIFNIWKRHKISSGKLCTLEVISKTSRGVENTLSAFRVNVLISSLTSPRANLGEFFERANFATPVNKASAKPRPLGQIIRAKPHPRGNIFKNTAKKPTKHEIGIMKNSTEMLICLEILKHLQ